MWKDRIGTTYTPYRSSGLYKHPFVYLNQDFLNEAPTGLGVQ
jgi:hypothetical protein